MICAPCSAADRAYDSWTSIIEAVSPVHVACTSGARRPPRDSPALARPPSPLAQKGTPSNADVPRRKTQNPLGSCYPPSVWLIGRSLAYRRWVGGRTHGLRVRRSHGGLPRGGPV